MTLFKTLIFTLIFSLTSGFAFAGPVNINTANAESLAVNIKGVGKKKAEAIIAYRQSNGPFKAVEEIMKVKGIGKKLLEKNRKNILISKK